MSGPTLNPLVSGDREISVSWVNDPNTGINNAFLFVLNKSNNVMTKLNLTDDEANSQSYLIADPSYNVQNGVVYMVQYVQQQDSATGVQYGSNTRVTSPPPAGPPATPVIALNEDLDEGAIVDVTFGPNNGSPYVSVQFRIADVSNNIMSTQAFVLSAPIPVGGDTRQFELTGLTNDVPYDVACYVFNGVDSCDDISNTIRVVATDRPNPPTNVAAASGMDSQIVVTFNNPASLPTPPTQGWVIERRVVGTINWEELPPIPYAIGPNPYTVIDNDVTNGIAYQYRVAGVNEAGQGAWSTSSTDKAVPFVPVSLLTGPSDGFTVVPLDESALALWSGSTSDATFITDISLNGFYDLAYSTPSTDFSYNDREFLDLSWNIGRNVAPLLVNKLLVSGLTNLATYNFRIRPKSLIPAALQSSIQYPPSIVDELPYALGDWAYANGVTPDVIPDAPTDLEFHVDTNLVQLNWIEPSTGGSAIDRYIVYGWNNELDASNNNVAAAIITQLVQPPVEYANVSVTDTISYWFRVTAGNPTGESPPSNLVGPAIPANNVDPPIAFGITQIDASSTYIDISVNWQAPLDQSGITITEFKLFSVNLITGALTSIYDVSYSDSVETYTYRKRFTPPFVPLVAYAVQTVGTNSDGSTTVSPYAITPSTPLNRPPTISAVTVLYNPITEAYDFTFTLNTYNLPLISSVLYAPPLNDTYPLPTPIQYEAAGAAYNNEPYTFSVDYPVPLGADVSYFVMFATQGGAVSQSVDI